MTSQNFSSNCLSFDSLKVRERCGLMSLAAHSRCTLAAEMPTAPAIGRQIIPSYTQFAILFPIHYTSRVGVNDFLHLAKIKTAEQPVSIGVMTRALPNRTARGRSAPLTIHTF